jgi:hypothetical protein
MTPSGDLCDFQMPNMFKAKKNKEVFILKYETLCFVYKYITVATMSCVSMWKEQQSYGRNVFLLDIT